MLLSALADSEKYVQVTIYLVEWRVVLVPPQNFTWVNNLIMFIVYHGKW